MAGPPQRRPGDGNDFEAPRHDPNMNFLGLQSQHGGTSGLGISISRLVRWLFHRSGDTRRP